MEIEIDWLDKLAAHHDNAAWLGENRNVVYQVLHEMMFSPELMPLGVQHFLKIHHFILKQEDLKPWITLLLVALAGALRTDTDQELIGDIFGSMGDTYSSTGASKIALAAYKNKLNRVLEQGEIEELVSAYIALFKAQMFRQDPDFNEKMVQEAVMAVKQLGSLRLQAALYQALAFAYTQRGETQQTLAYAQMAYMCWAALGCVHEMARTIFVMAARCREDGLLQLAEAYLEKAKSLYLASSDQRQYALLAYEQAALYRERGDYASAVAWSQIALQEFYNLKSPDYHTHFVAMSHHILGLSKLGAEEYNSARENLWEAFKLWLVLDKTYEQAAVYNALGYLEKQLRNDDTALSYFEQALALCQQLPEMSARSSLEAIIQNNIDSIIDDDWRC